MQALSASVYCLLINCCGHLFHDLTDLLASARLLERITISGLEFDHGGHTAASTVVSLHEASTSTRPE